MKQFMKTNRITHNLMSFTGFKSIYIFSLLLESPKSYKQIQQAVTEHEYLRETISADAVRIYINSLKKIGCKIESVTHNRIRYYYISSHPFKLKINKEQAESILKIYKAISHYIDLEDYLILQKFIIRFAQYISDEEIKNKILYASPINNANQEIINELIKYAKNKTEITVLYNSPNSGQKNITILADKLYINNGKLYISGINSEYKNYSGFLVSKIIKIVSVNLNSPTLETPIYSVRYELYKTDNTVFEPLQSEKIVEQTKEKYVIDITSKNKFDITQRILYHASKCKVISPKEYQQEIIDTLNKMKEGYID